MKKKILPSFYDLICLPFCVYEWHFFINVQISDNWDSIIVNVLQNDNRILVIFRFSLDFNFFGWIDERWWWWSLTRMLNQLTHSVKFLLASSTKIGQRLMSLEQLIRLEEIVASDTFGRLMTDFVSI